MSGQWIVLMEATEADASSVINRDDVGRLLAVLNRTCDGRVGALHGPDRYALQLTTTASGPAEALVGVLSSWTDALSELNLPTWRLVRMEVLTPEELERDRQNQFRDDLPIAALAARARLPRQECFRRRTSPPSLP